MSCLYSMVGVMWKTSDFVVAHNLNPYLGLQKLETTIHFSPRQVYYNLFTKCYENFTACYT